MLALSITFLFPLWFIIINSLKTKPEYSMSSFAIPNELFLSNYDWIIRNYNFLSYFINTLFIVSISTILIIFFAVCASYAFAKLEFRGKNILFFCVLATIFLPGQVSIIPAYVMFSKFGLINSPWAVILSYIAGGTPAAVLLMRGTFMGISNEMIESVKIDGAGYFSIIKNVIFPLGISAIVIVTIFNFINYWNDLLTPMIYLSNIQKQTVMVGLTRLMERSNSQPTRQYAGMMLSALPSIIIYVFLQKFMIKGLTLGSIK